MAEINVRADIPIRTDIGEQLTLAGRKKFRKTLYGNQEGFCIGCKNHYNLKDLEVDHIIPRSKGGTDHKHNLQLLCGNCNRKKGNRSQSEFLEDLHTTVAL